jgi:hypothetical protein
MRSSTRRPQRSDRTSTCTSRHRSKCCDSVVTGRLTRFLARPSDVHQGLYGIGGAAINSSADGPTGLAFDSAGDLFVAGFNTKDVLMVDPSGTLHRVDLYPRGDGGRSPDRIRLSSP